MGSEGGVGADLPLHRNRGQRHAAMRLQRLGCQSRPEDEAVGSGVPGRNAKRKGIGAKDLLRPHNGRRTRQKRRTCAAQQQLAS